MMRSGWTLPLRALAFLGWFTGQFLVTSLRVSALILTPGRQPEPGIVRFALDDLSDAELTLLIALVTITPDTLVIAVNREDREMFVHGMFVGSDPETLRLGLRTTQDRLIRGVRRRLDAAPARKDAA